MRLCHLGWGWGGGNIVHVNLNTHGLYGAHRKKYASLSFGVGLGWGGVGVITCMAT